MIKVIGINSIFRLSERSTQVVPYARTVGELLEREEMHQELTVIRDGHKLGRDHLLQDGDEIIVVGLPAGGIGAIIIGAIVNAAIGVGVSLLVNLLFGKPKGPSDRETSPTYGWSGIGNTTTQGSPIARIYGTHRVGGQVLSAYKRTADLDTSEEHLYLVRGLGSGPLNAIGQYTTDQDGLAEEKLPDGMQINRINPEAFTGVTCSLRMGRKNQAVLPSAFRKVVQPYEVDVPVSENWTVYKFHQPVVGFHINFKAPRGMFRMDSDGDIEERWVFLDVQWRAASWMPWQDLNDSTLGTGPYKIEATQTNPFTRTLAAEQIVGLTSATKIEIRVRRTTHEWNSQRAQDGVRIESVNEVENLDSSDMSYPGIAVVAADIIATEQLSGGLPVMTDLVRGVDVPHLIMAADGSPPQVYYAWSENPAWVSLDIATYKEDGLGNWISFDDVDVERWVEWAAHCDEVLRYREQELDPAFTTDETEATRTGRTYVVITGDSSEFTAGSYVEVEFEGVNQIASVTDLGGGRYQLDLVNPVLQTYSTGWLLKRVTLGSTIERKRHTYNGVFDRELGSWDAIMEVCQVGRAMPVLVGRTLSVRVEQAADPVQLISESAMVKDSFRIDYVGSAERADTTELQIVDAEQDYDQTTVPAWGSKSNQADAVVRKTFNRYGITNQPEARAEAHYQLRLSNFVRKKCSFSMPPEGLASEVGDVVKLAVTMPAWSKVVSRGMGTVSSLKIDHDITLEAGKSYTALVKLPGEPNAVKVSVTATAGTYAAGTAISTDGDATTIEDAQVVIGETGVTHTLWRILNITLKQDLTVDIEAIQYLPEVYADIGWFIEEVASEPPPSGCIDPGTYFISFETLKAMCPDPVAPPCDCEWVAGTTTIVCNSTAPGTACDCVTIDNVSGSGVTIIVGAGCEGEEFCLNIEVCYELSCTSGELTCFPLDPPTCGCVSDDFCYTICS